MRLRRSSGLAPSGAAFPSVKAFGAAVRCATAFGAVLASLVFSACEDRNPVSPAPNPDPGPWILDSVYTLDAFPYRADACAEVFPPGSASADTLPAGSAAAIRIVTTACYALTVHVVNADSDTVRTFSTRFALFNRSEGEKNRGVSSYAAWDGKDGEGKDLGPGRYLWRMEFDFGLGRSRRYRADILVPRGP
jgi:hypothetical protein